MRKTIAAIMSVFPAFAGIRIQCEVQRPLHAATRSTTRYVMIRLRQTVDHFELKTNWQTHRQQHKVIV